MHAALKRQELKAAADAAKAQAKLEAEEKKVAAALKEAEEEIVLWTKRLRPKPPIQSRPQLGGGRTSSVRD